MKGCKNTFVLGPIFFGQYALIGLVGEVIDVLLRFVIGPIRCDLCRSFGRETLRDGIDQPVKECGTHARSITQRCDHEHNRFRGFVIRIVVIASRGVTGSDGFAKSRTGGGVTQVPAPAIRFVADLAKTGRVLASGEAELRGYASTLASRLRGCGLPPSPKQ